MRLLITVVVLFFTLQIQGQVWNRITKDEKFNNARAQQVRINAGDVFVMDADSALVQRYNNLTGKAQSTNFESIRNSFYGNSETRISFIERGMNGVLQEKIEVSLDVLPKVKTGGLNWCVPITANWVQALTDLLNPGGTNEIAFAAEPFAQVNETSSSVDGFINIVAKILLQPNGNELKDATENYVFGAGGTLVWYWRSNRGPDTKPMLFEFMYHAQRTPAFPGWSHGVTAEVIGQVSPGFALCGAGYKGFSGLLPDYVSGGFLIGF